MKMNFIAQAVGGSAPFSTLRRNLKTGRSLCVSGLSAVCKADVIFTLIRENGGQALCVGVRLFVSPPTKRKRRPSATT